jgi:hypothetical protein
MNTFTTCSLVAALTMTASAAGAQTKTITGEQKTLTATIESIEAGSRSVTVKKPDGTYEVFYVPSSMKQFDTLKIGDKITAKGFAARANVPMANAGQVILADGRPLFVETSNPSVQQTPQQ